MSAYISAFSRRVAAPGLPESCRRPCLKLTAFSILDLLEVLVAAECGKDFDAMPPPVDCPSLAPAPRTSRWKSSFEMIKEDDLLCAQRVSEAFPP